MAELRRRNIDNAADSADETQELFDDQTERPRPELSTAESSDHVSSNQPLIFCSIEFLG